MCERLGSRAWASSAGLQFRRSEMVANSGTHFEQSLGTYVLRLLNSRQSFQDGTWLASWRGCNETLMEDDANALILFWDLRSAVSSVKLEDFCCGSYSMWVAHGQDRSNRRIVGNYYYYYYYSSVSTYRPLMKNRNGCCPWEHSHVKSSIDVLEWCQRSSWGCADKGHFISR